MSEGEVREVVVQEPPDHPGVFSEPTVLVHFSEYLNWHNINELRTYNNHYVLIGVFFNDEAEMHAYFSDARRHNELSVAIDATTFSTENFYYALAHAYLNTTGLIIGVHFNKIPGVNREIAQQNILNILGKINADLIEGENLPVSWRSDAFETLHQDIEFLYHKFDATLEAIPLH